MFDATARAKKKKINKCYILYSSFSQINGCYGNQGFELFWELTEASDQWLSILTRWILV